MVARKLADKGWFVDFWWARVDGSRERIRQKSPLQTKRGAEEFERQLRGEMLAPTKVRAEVLFEDFAREFTRLYAETKLKHSTQLRYAFAIRKRLLPIFAGRTLSSLDARAVLEFEKSLAHLKPKTIRNHMGELARMLAKAVEWNLIAAAPKVELPAAPKTAFRFLDEAECTALLAAAGSYHAPIFFALMTGCRMGEIFALTRGQLDLERGQVVIDRAVYRSVVGTPKHGKTRRVDLSPALVEYLAGLVAQPLPTAGRGTEGKHAFSSAGAKEGKHAFPSAGLVFPGAAGGPRNPRGADQALRAACARAGVLPCGWHVLRHTFASRLVSRGVSLQVVQELLGHAGIAETLRYAHLAPAVKRDAVARLDDLSGRLVPSGPAQSGQQMGNKQSMLFLTQRNR